MSSEDRPDTSFWDVDELLAGILDEVKTISSRIADLVNALSTLTGSDVRITRQTQQIEFSNEVAASTTTDSPDVVPRELPFDAEIVEILVGWPDGANNLVGVQLRTSDENILFPANPEDDFVAANDFTGTFPLVEDVNQEDELQVVYVNNDTANPHFINVVLTIRER